MYAITEAVCKSASSTPTARIGGLVNKMPPMYQGTYSSGLRSSGNIKDGVKRRTETSTPREVLDSGGNIKPSPVE
jgi:hypothetical protein